MLKQVDKQLHFLAGAVIALACGYFVPAWSALMVSVAVGGLKELYDSFHKDRHTPDLWDFYTTAAGSLAGGSVILIHQLL